MNKPEQRVTVSLEELALSNSMTLTALVELLEDKGGILRRDDGVRTGSSDSRPEAGTALAVAFAVT